MKPIDLRETIPAIESGIYCNWGAGGPSPRRVVEAAESVLERHEYEAAFEGGQYRAAFDAYEESRAAIAGLLGASPDEIALTESTADGINRIASGLEWTADDVVVRTDLEHSAGILPWKRLERERGIDVRVLETDGGRVDLEAVADAAADATLFCVSSVTWTHGTRLPVAEIVEIAHEAGALVLVDAVQSPGQTPVDVREWGADFVVGAGHKWLVGPFGSGFCYVREGRERTLTPAAIGYRSVAEPNADDYRYEAGARRLEVGSATPAAHAGLVDAIDCFGEMGLETVERRIERLTDRLKAGVDEDRLISPDRFESGLVTIATDDPEATVQRLAEEDIVVRSLPSSAAYPRAVRVSVHAFNAREEVDAVLEAL
ncbi:aminotransferase class V-fold PLP-dependent enzyme [Natrarchaeobius halalkaliphilus]|uniref:Aminotransferase class V-fold PLP-dependent enzyme n=1 Tax=Natrarchaeobius halalkaliphilus TaxID=1679091 RepID=A0A3N6NZE8_9EURY|nr:aminotransferase class V-fold PLP-dependent enzyme [Natrarchaeobius halalkaliphilus]RQG86916.1 aminotransferase class V-fold PLP-dependent enzyme [Natrarchaeobius halalkaliphilus]